MNSRDKGKRGEREAARMLEARGFGKARRGQQYNGLEGRDVVCDEFDNVHFEVKRTESLQLYPAIEQACQDAPCEVQTGEGCVLAQSRVPVVLHKKNHKKWVFIIHEDHIQDFVESAGRVMGFIPLDRE